MTPKDPFLEGTFRDKFWRSLPKEEVLSAFSFCAFVLPTLRLVEEGSELSEIATDIIIELLRTSSQDLGHYKPVIKVILPLLSGLQAKFQKLMAQGAHRAVEMDTTHTSEERRTRKRQREREKN